VDVVFEAGTLNAVVGPSGCGKSTLLRLIGAVDRGGSGSIEVGGVDLASLRGRPLRDYRRAVSTYVFQKPSANFAPHLRVRQHSGDPAAVSLLESVGLAARLEALPDQLSGGEQARAALAIALARHTPLLLLDEPTAELDRASAHTVIEVLEATARDGVNIVVATHDPDVIAAAGRTLDLSSPQDRGSAPDHRRVSRTGDPVLHVHRLTKRYGATRAVDDVSFSLGAGELGVVLGRSGSGKSTLLMLLGGWIAPDSGNTSLESTAWDVIGYLPQRFGLLPELSIGENVALPTRIAGGRHDPDERLLEQLDLGACAPRYPTETSVGQQQRAALARALTRQPTLLLADEPTAHQDTASAHRIWHVLREATEDGTACLIATHDASAATHGDRVWEITDGRVRSR
jgi:ABC-type lipoprotein export system ATPase subunit